MMWTAPIKDPDAVLDYKFDWAALTNGTGDSDWLDLDNSEEISTRVVTVDTGLTKASDALSDSNTSVTVWLSGGTAGTTYNMACKITTTAGRTDERTAIVTVMNR